MNSLVLEFPADYSIGTIRLRQRNGGKKWVEFSEAIGKVVIPKKADVSLRIHYDVDVDPTIFSSYKPAALAVFEWFCTSKASDAAIQYLQPLTGLEGLALWETNVGDEALTYVKSLHNLKWLDIGDTKITDDGLRQISEMSSLEELILLNDQITDSGIAHIQSLPQLRTLDLMNTLVTDQVIESLSKMTRLKYLRIFDTQMTERGYNQLQQALPACKIRYYNSNDFTFS